MSAIAAAVTIREKGDPMTIELTETQRVALGGKTAPRFIDPTTNATYVLVRAELFERMQALLDDDVAAMQHHLAELAPEDWEDAANYEAKP